jgi:MFS family permease
MLSSNILYKLRHHPLILPLYLPTFIFAFCQGLLVPILPLYAANFEVSYGLIGLVLAGEALGMLLGDIPAGMLLRWLGQKRAMLVGVACAALSTMALFWAMSVPEAFLYRFLSGFSLALFNISRHAYMTEAIKLSNRGRAIAVFGGINRIGKFAGPAIGGLIAAAYGLRVPFLLFAGAAIVALIVMAIFVRISQTSTPPGSASRVHHSHLFLALKLHHRILGLAGAGQLFAQMIRAGREVIIPLYAADVLGLGIQDIGFIISVAAAIDMSLFYPAGLVMDRWGRKAAIVPSFFIQAIAMSLVPLTWNFMTLLLAASLIGFGNGLGSGTMLTLGADLAPQESRGEFLGLWRLVGDLGSMGGPLIVGTVADLVVLPTAALAMSGAGMVAVLIFGLLVPETLKKPMFVADLTPVEKKDFSGS